MRPSDGHHQDDSVSRVAYALPTDLPLIAAEMELDKAMRAIISLDNATRELLNSPLREKLVKAAKSSGVSVEKSQWSAVTCIRAALASMVEKTEKV